MTIQNRNKVLRQLQRLSIVTGAGEGCEIQFSGQQAYHVDASAGRKAIINFPVGDFTDPDYLMMVNGLSDHENGHDRFTSKLPRGVYDGMSQHKTRFVNHFRNLFEDIRMEALVMETFPGSRQNLSDLVKMAIKRNLFTFSEEMAQNPEALLGAYYLYGLRSKVLTQTALDQWAKESHKAASVTFKKIFSELEAIFSRAEKLSSHIDCVNLATELYELIADESENEEDQESDENEDSNDDNQESNDGSDEQDAGDENSDNGDDSQGGEQEGSGDSEGNSGADDSDDEQSEDGSGAGGSGDENSDDEVESKEQGQSGSTGGDNGEQEQSSKPCQDLMNADGSGLPKDFHEELLAQMEEMAKDYQEKNPNIDHENHNCRVSGVSHNYEGCNGTVDAKMATRLSRPVKQTLQRILFQKNRVERKHSDRGRRLVSQRLSSIACGNKDVFLTTKVAKAENAAVSILVDNSGSMGWSYGGENKAKMEMANTVALAISKALDLVKGVECEVGYYPQGNDVYVAKPYGSTSVSHRFEVSHRGGTPTGASMMPVVMRLATQPQARKIMFVVTDGEAHDPQQVRVAIDTATNLGIKVFGIGIYSGENANEGFESVPFIDVGNIANLNTTIRDLIK